MKIIGLTGGIASGKSVIASWFASSGIPVIDADFVYKELSKPQQVLYNKIVKILPEGYFQSDLSIHWRKLGELVFRDDSFRIRLNELTHPIVKEEILRQIAVYQKKGEDYVIISVPLLFETGFHEICDLTVCVYVDRTVQLARLMERDQIDQEYAIRKIASQMPLLEKKELADYSIDNSGTLAQTKAEFLKVLAKMKE